jgi:competence protein ComEC
MFTRFWKIQPALFIGIHLLLGSAAAMCWSSSYLFALILLWLPLFYENPSNKKRLALTLIGCSLISLSLFAYTHCFYSSPPLKEKKCEGFALFSPTALTAVSSPFHQHSLRYQGKVALFHSKDESETLRNFTCSIHLPLNTARPLANCDYFLEGTLIEKERGPYLFKPAKKKLWQAIPNTFNLAEWRYLAKEKMRQFLKKHIPQKEALAFHVALVIGDIDERNLSYDFGRLAPLFFL